LAAAVRAVAVAEVEKASTALAQLQHAVPFLTGATFGPCPDERLAWAEISADDIQTSALVGLASLFVSGIPALPRSGELPTRPFSAWLNAERIFEEAARSMVQSMFPVGVVLGGADAETPLLTAISDDPPPIDRVAEPDIVIRTQPTILLDVKYRTHERLYTEDELYQLMAHATAFDAAAAALLTTAGAGAYGTTWLGRDAAGHAFYVIRVDPSSLTGMRSLLATWFTAILQLTHSARSESAAV